MSDERVLDNPQQDEDHDEVCSVCGRSKPFPAWHYRSECTNAPVVTRAEYEASLVKKT